MAGDEVKKVIRGCLGDKAWVDHLLSPKRRNVTKGNKDSKQGKHLCGSETEVKWEAGIRRKLLAAQLWDEAGRVAGPLAPAMYWGLDMYSVIQEVESGSQHEHQGCL